MARSLVLNRRPKVPAEDTAAFGAIAERFRRAGALEQAVSLCRDGLKKFPDHVSARVTLGWSLLDLGRYDEAREALEEVMRRAPDNLAAIRGMAELHDRFEHTLNLPMDGPGQWPPPAESMDAVVPEDLVAIEATIPDVLSDFDDRSAAALSAFAGQDPVVEVEEDALSLAPAELGLPLWSPEPAAAESVAEILADTTSPIAPEEPREVAATTPVAPPAPVATSPTAASPGSGMSSVREIDPFAGAAVPASVPPPAPVAASTPIELSAVEEAVSEDAIAALLAESDSLDAVADLQVTAASSFEPIGEIELSQSEPLEAFGDVAPFDQIQQPSAIAASETTFDEFAQAATVAPAETTLAAQIVVEPAVAFEDAQTSVEPVAAIEPEPESPVTFEAAAQTVETEPATLPVLSAEASSIVADSEADPVLGTSDVEVEARASADVLEFAARSAVEATVENVLEPAIENAVEDAAVAAASDPGAVEPLVPKNVAALAALERMLARVRSRRLELMAESVA